MPKKTPSFRRPDHNDFRTAAELEKLKFTGVRKYDMTMEYQFWILGEIVKRVSFREVATQEKALEKAHFEVFKF